MSASREKKQRQVSTANGPSDKQRREMEEAQKARSKTILYTVVGIVIAVLVIALLVWNSGIFEKNKVVATVGDQDYTVTELGFYFYPSYNYMANLFGGTVDADTAASIRQQALDSLHQYAALYTAALKDGYTVDDNIQAQVDGSVEQIRNYAAQNGTTFSVYLRSSYGPYMTEKVLRECLTQQAVANAYYSDHADSLTYDKAQLESYYAEHKDELDSFTYSAAFINGEAVSSTDADGNTVDPTDAEKATAMSVAKATAEDLAQQAEAGGDFDALAEEFAGRDDKSSFKAETTALGSALTSALNADCTAWLTDAARESGDITTIEVADSGYWVVKFVNRFLNEDSYGSADIRHILVLADVADGETTPTQEAMDASKAEAQRILDEFAAGEQTPEAFGELAKQYSEDPGSKDSGGLYAGVTPTTSFFTGFLDWIFADGRQIGDTGLVENTQEGQSGWHV
ncbi:peptidylprolyl isomerase, partial [Intestinimonas butyriciproducens]